MPRQLIGVMKRAMLMAVGAAVFGALAANATEPVLPSSGHAVSLAGRPVKVESMRCRLRGD